VPRLLACICFAGLAWAQGTDPKPKVEEYEIHAAVKDASIGAEYMVHSFSGQGATFIAPDHLVVEVAIFPLRRSPTLCSSQNFVLRVDGKTLRPVSAEMVAISLQRRDWRPARGVQATAGTGDDTVILGAPTTPVPPFGGQRRTPMPPRAPAPEDRSGLPPAEKVRADELVVSAALPEGEFRAPVSGFVYFPFEGKASRIKSVELIYGDTKLKLK
jgi:hypothetical protein